MTQTDKLLEALDTLRRELPGLNAAAIPTKSEVYTLCGWSARKVHDAIETITTTPTTTVATAATDARGIVEECAKVCDKIAASWEKRAEDADSDTRKALCREIAQSHRLNAVDIRNIRLSDASPVELSDLRAAMGAAIAKAKDEGASEDDIATHWLAYHYLEQFAPIRAKASEIIAALPAQDTLPIPVWDVREVEDCGHRGMKGYEVLLPDGTWTDVAAHSPEDAIATANLDWRAALPNAGEEGCTCGAEPWQPADAHDLSCPKTLDDPKYDALAAVDPAVRELAYMLDMVTPEQGTVIFDHTPEEIGLHVMENYQAIRKALTTPEKDA